MDSSQPAAIDEMTDVLISSICGPLFNKIKTSFQYARKNKDLAANTDLRNLVFLLGEQILPQWCQKNCGDKAAINEMHNLVYLLAQKTHQVFFTRVIHTIIDQNWDLKGFRQVLGRILKTIDLRPSIVRQTIEKSIDKINQSQNLQSTSCIRILSSYLRNVKKEIKEDDLRNPLKTYQTDFEFLKEDIERYRRQNMSHECFQVLHPWAYELDSVDLKYVLNNDVRTQVQHYLQASKDAQVFWLSFFKPSLACPADEFFEAIRQLCEVNKARGFWAENASEFEQMMQQTEFVINLELHADLIVRVIKQFIGYTQEKNGGCVLRDQFKMYHGNFTGTSYADAKSLVDQFEYLQDPVGPLFSATRGGAGGRLPANLSQINLCNSRDGDLAIPAELLVMDMILKSDRIPEHTVCMKFTNADTDELRNVEFKFRGDKAIFKVGEAERNHFQIPNDKKLLESQFMVICANGQYYIRDLGFVHTSRIKLDLETEVQLHQDSVVDVGKIVHYHFDKLLHYERPTARPSQNYFIMRQEGMRTYELDKDDFPYLRARPCWISPEENEDSVQNEINIFADGTRNQQTIGRSSKRDIQLKLKAVSAEHCQIGYKQDRGWTISEKGKSKLSSNGTFVFLKTLDQSKNRIPSDMIPLHDDMTISFVNYELKVNLVPMTAAELRQLSQEQEDYFRTRPKGALGFRFDANFPVMGDGMSTAMMGSIAGDNESTMIKGSEYTVPTQKMQVTDKMMREDQDAGKINNAPEPKTDEARMAEEIKARQQAQKDEEERAKTAEATAPATAAAPVNNKRKEYKKKGIAPIEFGAGSLTAKKADQQFQGTMMDMDQYNEAVKGFELRKQGPKPKADPIPEKDAAARKEYIKKAGANNKLAEMLGKYDGFAAADKENLDQMWAEHDIDMNGLLDRGEAKTFLEKLKSIVSPERAGNYNEANFDKVFDLFDEDKNGFLTKSEMAVLIKKLFAKPKVAAPARDSRGIDAAKLQAFIDKYEGSGYKLSAAGTELDEVWDKADVNDDGKLTKKEATDFFMQIQKALDADEGKKTNLNVAKMGEIMKKFDSNGDNCLDKKEVARCLEQIYCKQLAEAKKVKLTYCNAYGLAEPVRMMLCKSGVDFEDERANDKEFCCCLPGGEELKDAAAVYAKIANQCGYHTPDAEGQKDIDQLVKDFQDAVAKLQDMCKQTGDERSKCCEEACTCLTKILNDWKDKFPADTTGIYGEDKCSIADFVLAGLYANVFDNEACEEKDKFKALLAENASYEAWAKKFLGSDQMQNYLKSRPKCAF